jgi:septal ring factor EnvC (AmiA/AmiB activator)
MNAPDLSFLKRNREPVQPALPPLPRQERQIDAETTAEVEKIIQTRRERDQLREQVHALDIDNGFLRERIRVLEESLTEAERKRDIYQFHSAAFTTRLHDLDILAEEQSAVFRRMLGEMMRQAKEEAFAPRVTPPSKLPEFDGAPELAEALAPERTDA